MTLRGDPNGRPVLDQDAMLSLGHQIVAMTTADTAVVSIDDTVRSVTHMGEGQVRSANDGRDVKVGIELMFGSKHQYISTNQVDLEVLRALVKRCESLALDEVASGERLLITHDVQDTYIPVTLWHDTTIEAMRTTRASLLPHLLQPATKHGLRGSGFVGFMARASAIVTKDNIQAYCEETDSEVSLTVRTADSTSSGWAGQTDRHWEKIDPLGVTERAIDLAWRGVNPLAFEPGRRTTILSREAVAQLLRFFAYFYDSLRTEVVQETPFSTAEPPNNKIGRQVFDERITITSDPNDPDGGFIPFFEAAHANPAAVWTEKGILKQLAYGASAAVARGKVYSEDPYSLRVSGGPTTVEAMIACCQEGIYVNHFSGVDLIDMKTGLMTGTTCDGCFLIKDGKIATPVRNFTFVDSPMFFLNQLVAIGESKRAAYGDTPPGRVVVSGDGQPDDESWPPASDWPRRPMIVPPLMVRDFNFTSLAEAV